MKFQFDYDEIFALNAGLLKLPQNPVSEKLLNTHPFVKQFYQQILGSKNPQLMLDRLESAYALFEPRQEEILAKINAVDFRQVLDDILSMPCQLDVDIIEECITREIKKGKIERVLVDYQQLMFAIYYGYSINYNGDVLGNAYERANINLDTIVSEIFGISADEFYLQSRRVGVYNYLRQFILEFVKQHKQSAFFDDYINDELEVSYDGGASLLLITTLEELDYESPDDVIECLGIGNAICLALSLAVAKELKQHPDFQHAEEVKFLLCNQRV
jgi:hypothetical protein